MSLRTLINRRDPWWQADGPAARRENRRRRTRGLIAIVAAAAAVVAAAFAWVVELGIAGASSIHLSLPLG
jgi:hypothetical protein